MCKQREDLQTKCSLKPDCKDALQSKNAREASVKKIPVIIIIILKKKPRSSKLLQLGKIREWSEPESKKRGRKKNPKEINKPANQVNGKEPVLSARAEQAGKPKTEEKKMGKKKKKEEEGNQQ